VIYNSAILIGPDGEIVGIYDKTHPFPLERRDCGGWVTVGNRADVFETSLGSIGMIICYDGDFPELSRLLAVKGAEVIVRPSALLRSFDIWYITNAARRLDPDPLRYVTWGSKSPQSFDHLEDRNLELYEGILRKARSRFKLDIRD